MAAEVQKFGRGRVSVTLAALACVLLPAASASAAPPDPGEYQEDDFSGGEAYNIVGPG